jgi:hypothetical protein
LVKVSGFEKTTLASIPSPSTNLKQEECVVKRLASWLHGVRKFLDGVEIRRRCGCS